MEIDVHALAADNTHTREIIGYLPEQHQLAIQLPGADYGGFSSASIPGANVTAGLSRRLMSIVTGLLTDRSA